jgi:hypothetical protein
MSRRRRVKVISGKRDPDRFPRGDEDLVDGLMVQVREAHSRGLPRPAILLLMEERVLQYDLPALIEPERSLQSAILAAVAGQPGVECMVLAGTLRMRRGREGLRALAVFVEWPDNRWALSWQGIDAQGALIGDEPIIRRAVEGWPRPSGLGGWFSRARRDRLRLRISGDDSQARVH